MVQEQMGESFCTILSSIDFVKSLAKRCGWDGTKTPRNRKFLSDLKDLLTEWDDIPFKKIKRKIDEIKAEYSYYDIPPTSYCIFVDVREPIEIQKCCEQLGAKSLLIRSASRTETTISNHADQNVEEYNYDIIIENQGTLEDLLQISTTFIQEEIKKKP